MDAQRSCASLTMQPNARTQNGIEWQVLPMLNPDGVIIGNYRCNLGGVDLNREWQQPSAAVSPEILAVKELFRLTCQVWPPALAPSNACPCAHGYIGARLALAKRAHLNRICAECIRRAEEDGSIR